VNLRDPLAYDTDSARMAITRTFRRSVASMPSGILPNSNYDRIRLQGLNATAPVFNRKQAEEWREFTFWAVATTVSPQWLIFVTVRYQEQVVDRARRSVQQLPPDARGHPITRRPFEVTWYMNQLAMLVAQLYFAMSLLRPFAPHLVQVYLAVAE
jgi:hypothetical protein